MKRAAAGKQAASASVESVRECIAKLNRGRAAARELERRLKPYLDAKRTVARYMKENPGTGLLFDNDDEHYCYPITNKQTRFNPEKARELLGDAAAECYEERTTLSVGFSADKGDELELEPEPEPDGMAA